jgi:peptidoglycan/LPS O-acetylase OafA/YrhL
MEVMPGVEAPQTRLKSLDGWRAVSVLVVIWSHIWLYSSMKVPGVPLSGHAGMGVELFFGISGFVITRGLSQEFSRFGRINLAAFYIRRGFRILPPLILYMAIVCLLWSFRLVETDAGLFRALTFTCNLGTCGGWLGAHTWSLSVEEQFYVFIPGLLALTIASRREVVTAIALGLPVLIMALAALKPPALAFAPWEYGVLLGQFATIFFGVTAALHETVLRRFFERAPAWLWIAALAGLLVIWALPPGRIVSVVRVFGMGPLIMTILLGSAMHPSILTGWLSWRPVQALGRVSYGVYLYQQLATYAFPGATWIFYLVSVTLCIICAFASFHFLEQPLVRIAARWSDRRKEMGVAARTARAA